MESVKEGGRVQRMRAAMLKLAFEELYSHFAWAYDWVSRTFFRGQWRVWQRATLRFIRGSRVLEIGMGTGNLQLDLLRAGYEAYGIDLSPQMVREAARKARRVSGVPFRACRARAEALPFPDCSFDSVVSTFPSEYITGVETLKELSRVLRPGGRLVVVPAGWLKPKDARGRALEGFARLVYGYKGSSNPDLEELERRAREGSGWHKWLVSLREGMAGSGFEVSAHIASNEIGAALIVVADKTP
jgi:SAM-dependent methyltransferase